MKEITKETINEIDEYVFQLSETQVDEWLTEIKKHQYNLHHQLVFAANRFPDKRLHYFIIRMYMMFYKSLESYKIKIPLITKTDLRNWIGYYYKMVDKITIEENHTMRLYHVADEINQFQLIHYIIKKFGTTTEEEIKMEAGERGALVAVLSMYVWGICGKLKPLLPSDDGTDKVKYPFPKRVSLEDGIRGQEKLLKEIADNVIKLQEDFDVLHNDYGVYFDTTMKHSNLFHSYLETWVKLEKSMVLMKLDKSQYDKMDKISKLSQVILTEASAAMTKVDDAKIKIKDLTQRYIDNTLIIAQTFPDIKNCYLLIDKLKDIYEVELHEYEKLKGALPAMNERLSNVDLLMKENLN
jgi:hypothetical protein